MISTSFTQRIISTLLVCAFLAVPVIAACTDCFCAADQNNCGSHGFNFKTECWNGYGYTVLYHSIGCGEDCYSTGSVQSSTYWYFSMTTHDDCNNRYESLIYYCRVCE